MSSKLNLAILGLRISAILYYVIILACLISTIYLSGAKLVLPIFVALFTLPFVVFLELLMLHLRRRRYWAWIAGLVVGGLYVPSLFLPLGVMIFVGLLSDSTRKEFEQTNKTAS